MMYRVIISHNQSDYLAKFQHTNRTVVVFDDPADSGVAVCKTLGYNYVFTESTGNRGSNRNAGLMEIFNIWNPKPDEIIEFLDGDRCPDADYSTGRIEEMLTENSLDGLLYTCGEHDARMSKYYVPIHGSEIIDTGTLCNPFYSCGFAMRCSTIFDIMDFNNGNFFEPRFTGWGCEDQYLGLICYHLKKRIGITAEFSLNGRVGGDSDFHRDYRDSLQTYIDLIRERNLEIRNG